MGYRIDYGCEKRIRRKEKRLSGIVPLAGMILLVLVMTLNWLWPEGVSALRQILMPGDPVVTAAAMEEFTESLRLGEGLADSLRMFCVRILEGADFDTSG